MKRILLVIALLTFGGAAKAQSGHTATVTWGASTPGPGCPVTPTIAYNVFRGTASGSENATPVNPSPITTLNFVDGTVSAGITYFYQIQAVETCGTFAPLLSAM